MRPIVVGIVLALVLFACLIPYYFSIPDTINASVRNAKAKTEGYWGKPDADFNWCEPDYQYTFYIAEPFNTFSSFFYVLATVFGIVFHSQHKIEQFYYFLLSILTWMGLGSVAFHASLRYKMQLLDELPMHWLVTFSSYAMWRRHTGPKKIEVLTMLAIEIFLLVGSYMTAREDFVHEIFRGTMAASFAYCFVSVFVLGASLSQEIDSMLTQINKTEHHDAQKFFQRIFKFMVLGLVSWIADVAYCPILHSLPFNLPYPQLHMFWHLFSSLAIYHLSITIFWHRHLLNKQQASIRWILGNIPYIAFDRKEL